MRVLALFSFLSILACQSFGSTEALLTDQGAPQNEPSSTTLAEFEPVTSYVSVSQKVLQEKILIPQGDSLDLSIDEQDIIYVRSLVFGDIYRFDASGNSLPPFRYKPQKNCVPSRLIFDNDYIYLKKSISGNGINLLTEIDSNGKVREIPLKGCLGCDEVHVLNGTLSYEYSDVKVKIRDGRSDHVDPLPNERAVIEPFYAGVLVKYRGTSFTIPASYFYPTPYFASDDHRSGSDLRIVLEASGAELGRLHDGSHPIYDKIIWVCYATDKGKIQRIWKLPSFGPRSFRGIEFLKSGEAIGLFKESGDTYSLVKWSL